MQDRWDAVVPSCIWAMCWGRSYRDMCGGWGCAIDAIRCCPVVSLPTLQLIPWTSCVTSLCLVVIPKKHESSESSLCGPHILTSFSIFLLTGWQSWVVPCILDGHPCVHQVCKTHFLLPVIPIDLNNLQSRSSYSTIPVISWQSSQINISLTESGRCEVHSNNLFSVWKETLLQDAWDLSALLLEICKTKTAEERELFPTSSEFQHSRAHHMSMVSVYLPNKTAGHALFSCHECLEWKPYTFNSLEVWCTSLSLIIQQSEHLGLIF